MTSTGKARKWFVIKIDIESEFAFAAEHFLSEFGALGTEINNIKKPPAEPVTVIGYFDDRPDPKTFELQFRVTLSDIEVDEKLITGIEFTTLDETDWLAEWKKFWKPTQIGNFVIAPPWELVDESAGIVIRIEPNMAFGTGTHETTQLCLRALEENYLPGDSFLDVGTGTGILAIAVAKMVRKTADNDVHDRRAVNIAAYDIDETSIAIARENAELNGVGSVVRFETGPFTGGSRFDLVCANLTFDAIVPILPTLLASSDRVLVLSGILREQETEIVSRLEDVGASNYRVSYAGEWISVVVRRVHS